MLSVISTLMILVEIAVFIAFTFSSPKATPTLIGIFFASSNVRSEERRVGKEC